MELIAGCGIQLLSIGISDGIELFFNKQVHKEHNCPDIMHMDFDNYGHTDAFISGIKVSWYLIITEIVILLLVQFVFNKKYDVQNLYVLSVINILIPIIINPSTCSDIYMSHKVLYLVNFVIILLIILQI